MGKEGQPGVSTEFILLSFPLHCGNPADAGSLYRAKSALMQYRY